MPKINNPRDNIVDEFEIGKILNAIQDDKPLLFAVAMAYLTGARISEILMLRAKDFTDDGVFWSVSVPTLKQRIKIHGREPRRTLIITKEKIYDKVVKPYLDRQVDLTRPLLFPNSRTALADRLRTRYPDVYFHWFRHCVSEDTKILTVSGWKDYQDIKNGDDIYSYNIDKDLIEKDKVNKINVFPYDGDAYHFKTGHLDLLCTPEHNSVFNVAHYKQISKNPNKFNSKWDGFKLNTAENILNTKNIRLLKHKTSSVYNGKNSIGMARASLMGWILTDGCIKKNGKITISQCISANSHKCKLIEDTLIASNVKYSKSIGKTRKNPYNSSGCQMITFCILKNTSNANRSGVIPDHEWIYKYVTKDRLPKYNLLNLKQEELLALYDAIMLGDGSRGSELCMQNEYKLEFFRTLCSFIGKTAITNLGQHNMKQKGEMKFRTYVTNKSDTNILLKKNFKKDKYTGKMWCPTTNNKTWIAQRNGRIFITGNSRATLWSRNVKGDIFKLRYIMGWQDIRMANRYVHNQNMAQSLRGDL
jgi:hypothetical protein